MGNERFEKLARELADRDRDLPARLREAGEHAARLRARAASCVESFRAAALERGAAYLAGIEVGPVEPDEKHVDCVQFRIARGRWELTCVAKAKGEVTLVGPYRRGKPEEPCSSYAFDAEDAGRALEDLLVAFIRAASER